MFFGEGTTKKCIADLKVFEVRELKTPTTTIFMLISTLRLGTVIKENL